MKRAKQTRAIETATAGKGPPANRAGGSRTAPLVLASASPRRRSLLKGVGLMIEVRPVYVDESPRSGESGPALARRLAAAKARAAARRFPGRVVLGADTVVLLGREVLGKPRNAADARRMLQRLSGRWHEVITAVALVLPAGRPLSAISRSRVRFARLTREEIENYVAAGEPFGKAGAYALQGAAGWFVAAVRGSASNVIGLPLERVRRLFARAGLATPRLGLLASPAAPSFSGPLRRGTSDRQRSPSTLGPRAGPRSTS